MRTLETQAPSLCLCARTRFTQPHLRHFFVGQRFHILLILTENHSGQSDTWYVDTWLHHSAVLVAFASA